MDLIKKKLRLLPEHPGVYMMKNAAGTIIYVGKAKILKNRVRSYFTGSHDQKTQKLVSEITDFEYILTASEVEALLLECNLIKKYNPHYNIMLRDDKSYPYILITSEKHPRIIVTRKMNKKEGKFYGPYPNATAARETARLLNRLFPFRKCNHIPAKPCLYFHLGQCLGPCTQEVSPEDYKEVLDKANMFLRGNQKSIITWLEGKMHDAASSLQFEAAREYRDLMTDLQKINEKQNITLNDFKNRDIIAYSTGSELISIQIFCFRLGNLITREGFIFPYYSEPEEAFISFLVQYYANSAALPDEICIPEISDTSVLDLYPLVVPKKGKTRELIRLAESNAKTVLEEKTKLENIKTEELNRTLGCLAEVLRISEANIIEAFDISGLSGTNVVGGMVQFAGGNPCRSNYRKYNIQHFENNNDDTAYLKHVIFRRYSRLISENAQLPDLILVDGGKGQVKAALSVLRELGRSIPVAGMVKDDRHETRNLIDSTGMELSLGSLPEVFRFIQRIQEEVHRFAITFHRQQRIKKMTSSELDGIPGIGPRRKRLLFRTFLSIERIKNASVEELKNAGLPVHAAQEIYDYFQKGNT
ncbi:MAG: UvrABC system protein C [Candidatus Dichloromethanomonas elyunquensis]|nr:MAG: UvrABC system protein C [Candidatus Dichloromethanomonas elyunquensis]